MVLKKRSFMDLHLEKFEHRRYQSRFLGMFHFSQPVLTIRDPDLIHQMFVKDMYCFAARHSFMPSGMDDFWDANIFALESGNWRAMRKKLAPVFSSVKMKKMFPFMMETAMQYVEHLTDNNMTEFHTKDTFRRYGTDVITNVILGIESDSTGGEENEFYKFGKEMSKYNGFLRCLSINIAQVCPPLGRLMGIKGFDPNVLNFFLKTIQRQIKYRKENHIERGDMLDLLIRTNISEEAAEDTNIDGNNGYLCNFDDHEDEHQHNSEKHKQEEIETDDVDTGYATSKELPPGRAERDILEYQNLSRKELTDVDITAQIMFFFISSHDTVSTALSFLCYELSRHHKIQECLRQEIDTTIAQFLDLTKVSYEAICGMEYLDQVVCESLRKWPAAIFADRKVLHSYNIPRTLTSMENYPYENDVHLEPGDVVVVPIYAIHRSPQYFQNPKVFDPTRFDKKNKHKIKPYTYMPFGVGGRNCIGSRFALMQIKVITVHLLAKFRLHLVKKTSLNLAKGLYNLDSEDGIWLGLEKRSSH